LERNAFPPVSPPASPGSSPAAGNRIQCLLHFLQQNGYLYANEFLSAEWPFEHFYWSHDISGKWIQPRITFLPLHFYRKCRKNITFFSKIIILTPQIQIKSLIFNPFKIKNREIRWIWNQQRILSKKMLGEIRLIK
jgi:hypothetical protein